ncbi:UrcA family protein [Povalibacter sp.]|uniref:UrcA family protein n=1 Tax=Povalibacter sp. TaxID=1962978 RepID=UPI002F41F528
MSARSFIAAIAAAGVVTGSLLAASVQARPAAPQIRVPLDRYDLSKQAHADQLYSRLQRAARTVCGSREARELKIRQLNEECYATALANAVTDVNDAKLTALHQSDSELRIASRGDRPRS